MLRWASLGDAPKLRRRGFIRLKSFHSFRLDAANHCVWDGEARLPLTPKAEWMKWTIIVRRSLGLPEYTSSDKVLNRIRKMFFDWSVPLIPTQKGETFWVWLIATLGLASYIALSSFFVLGAMLFLIFGGAAVLYGIVTFLGTLFRS